MSRSVLYMSMSLDGFITGPGDGAENGLGARGGVGLPVIRTDAASGGAFRRAQKIEHMLYWGHGAQRTFPRHRAGPARLDPHL